MEKPAKAVNIRHRKHISTFPVWVVFLCMLPGILHYTIFRLFPSPISPVSPVPPGNGWAGRTIRNSSFCKTSAT